MVESIANLFHLLQGFLLGQLWIFLRFFELIVDLIALHYYFEVLKVVDEKLRIVEQNRGCKVGLEEVLERLVAVFGEAMVFSACRKLVDFGEDRLGING